jgi:long-chain acyl-CoA synthetase
LYGLLEAVCKKNASRVFFVRDGRTYGDLLTAVKKRAVLLAQKFKIKKGDTVAILSGNTPEFMQTYFAVSAIGARALMLDTGLAPVEHVNMMKHTKCKLACAQKSLFVEGAAKMFDIETIDDTDPDCFEMADVTSDDILQLSFTSGSTGNPKVVGLTHGNLTALWDGAQFYKQVIHPGFMFYGFLPLYHIYGVVINIIAPVSLECSLLLQPVLNPKEFLADFQKYHPEVIPAVPRIWEGFYKKIIAGLKEKRVYTLARVILALQKYLPKKLVNKIKKPIHEIFGGRVRVLISAGATLKPTVRKFFEKLGFSVGDCYGLTETTGPANFNFKFRMDNGKMYYAGPLKGNEIIIHAPNDEGIGEVWVRGNLVMKEYVGNKQATDEAFENGWFKTGDLGVIDKKGRLTIKGRMKQVIVLDSGKNVYPDELEDLYLQNDDILAAAVLEREIDGKMVAYGVFQVKPGTNLEMFKLMLKASNLKIAPYKWVTHYAITEDELPQTSAKKIQHHKIAEMLDRGEFPTRVE